MHGPKYQLLAVLTMVVVLLFGDAFSRAYALGTLTLPNGLLPFTVEEQSGKNIWASCSLNLEGDFRVRSPGGTSISGKLSEQEARRIIEECGKLCERTGKGVFQPAPLFLNGKTSNPLFVHMTPQGDLLRLIGPDQPAPPELTAFLRILWQKLLTHPSQQPFDNRFGAPAKR